jgi:hypothetical protein
MMEQAAGGHSGNISRGNQQSFELVGGRWADLETLPFDEQEQANGGDFEGSDQFQDFNGMYEN